MVGHAGHGHGRRDAQEHQHRRHQEAAADAEQAGDEADQGAQSHQQGGVHGHLGDGQVEVQSLSASGLRAAAAQNPAQRVRTESRDTVAGSSDPVAAKP